MFEKKKSEIIIPFLLLNLFIILIICNYFFIYGEATDLSYYVNPPANANFYHQVGITTYNLVGFNGAIFIIFFLIPLLFYNIIQRIEGEEIAFWSVIFLLYATIVPLYFIKAFVFSQTIFTLIFLVVLCGLTRFNRFNRRVFNANL